MTISGLEIVKAIQAGRSRIPPAPWIKHMRVAEEQVIELVEPGHIVSVWTPGPHWGAADGFVIGGAVAGFVDGVLGLTVLSSESEIAQAWWTLDLHTRFLRPIKVGQSVHIESRVRAKTKTSAIAEVTLTIESDKVAVTATAGFRAAGDRRTLTQPPASATSV